MSKKSSTFAAKMKLQEFNHLNYVPVKEVTSKQPCEAWKPKEALSVREMLIRSERGQRLDVHTRFRAEGIPDNMYPFEYEVDPRTGEVKRDPQTGDPIVKRDILEDTFDHTPPDGINDITDLEAYSEEIAARKRLLQEKRKKAVANAKKPDPTPKPEEKPKESPAQE